MPNQKLEQAVYDLFTGVNSFSGNDAMNSIDVVRVFNKTHRTLQQSLMRVVIIPILKRLAKDYADGAYDGRNFHSAALAAKMLAAVSEDDLYLPFV